MKITKTQLKRIIKEELEATLTERDGPPSGAEQMAKTFSKDPLIMAAVRAAAEDPDVQRAAQEELSEGPQRPPDHPIDQAITGAATGVGLSAAMLTPDATRWAHEKAMLPEFANMVAEVYSVQALGITGGVAMAAITLLVANELARYLRTR
jgi:hypothetical protein